MLFTVPGCSVAPPESPAPGIQWRAWGDEMFAEAARERRLIVLDLGAVWCHWCHVMERETWGNPGVRQVVDRHYLAVHVDQDERPDLAHRYEDYGWPATVIFRWDGVELARLRGYVPPGRMKSLLEAFAADPTPGPSAAAAAAPAPATEAALAPELRERLRFAWEAAYDPAHAGWGDVHKYLDPDCVELAILEGRDAEARGTLDAMLALVDPAWGGVYQYSHGGTWDNPHFEKIMSFQAEDLRIYALAWRIYRDPRYLEAARAIERYLMAFLRAPSGAFYASQDADLVPGEHAGDFFALDDAGRRKRGIPRVDTRIYARENGWGIAALAHLYRATNSWSTLRAALDTARVMIETRGLPGGGFSHDGSASGPFLADNVAMARAFFELHQATQNEEWLERASGLMGWIDRTFRGDAGYLAASPGEGPVAPTSQTDENIAILRLALRLDAASEGRAHRGIAEHAARLLAGRAQGANGVRAAGLLLADRELSSGFAVVTLEGRRGSQSLVEAIRELLEAPSTDLVLRSVLEDNTLPAVTVDPETYASLCVDGRCLAPRSPYDVADQLAGRPRKR